MLARRGARPFRGLLVAALLAAATAAAPAAAATPFQACPTCAPPGAPVDAGASVRRDVGPAVFRIFIDPEVARATVSVALGDATRNGVTLDYRARTAPISLAAGPCRIDGTLMLRINEAPGVSALYLDGVVQLPAQGSTCAAAGPPALAWAFRGDLAQWRSPVPTVLLRDRHFLTANLAVQIDLLPDDAAGQTVALSFFIGDQLILSTPVMFSGIVTLSRDVSAGETTIRQGASFTLNPASPVSAGSLVARNLTITTGGTSVDASGVLSSWPAPPAGPPPGQPPPDAEPAPDRAAPR
jgi:hypothetical protein